MQKRNKSAPLLHKDLMSTYQQKGLLQSLKQTIYESKSNELHW